ncbi:hypothetical protein [Flavobacterium sp.]|uniref:hypothetical protein n=1 Tax=Flavobacterium sp. TaxID=239 RepID=UPI00261CB259|nr:hypothetical protein [Flavobacterium sp.]
MIRLSTFEDNSFEPFKNLTKEQYDYLQKDGNLIKSTYKQFVVFKYLQLNLNDYFKFIEKWTNVPNNGMIVLSTHVVFILEVNKLLLNVLIAFKFFLDNAETYLKRKYNKDSQIVENYTQLTRNIFDNSFAYRFLSKLRNYSAHLGFPLEYIHFDINFNHENPELSTTSPQLILNIESLKKEKDLFGKIVMQDLENWSGKLDLIPLIIELSHHIMTIQKYIYKSQKEELEEAIENIECFIENKKTEKNQIKVYTLTERDGETVTMNIYDVPCEIISEIKSTTKNWS